MTSTSITQKPNTLLYSVSLPEKYMNFLNDFNFRQKNTNNYELHQQPIVENTKTYFTGKFQTKHTTTTLCVDKNKLNTGAFKRYQICKYTFPVNVVRNNKVLCTPIKLYMKREKQLNFNPVYDTDDDSYIGNEVQMHTTLDIMKMNFNKFIKVKTVFETDINYTNMSKCNVVETNNYSDIIKWHMKIFTTLSTYHKFEISFKNCISQEQNASIKIKCTSADLEERMFTRVFFALKEYYEYIVSVTQNLSPIAYISMSSFYKTTNLEQDQINMLKTMSIIYEEIPSRSILSSILSSKQKCNVFILDDDDKVVDILYIKKHISTTMNLNCIFAKIQEQLHNQQNHHHHQQQQHPQSYLLQVQQQQIQQHPDIVEFCNFVLDLYKNYSFSHIDAFSGLCYYIKQYIVLVDNHIEECDKCRKGFCIVCFVKHNNVALVSCGHLLCDTCIKLVDKCPICRSYYLHSININFNY